MAAVATGPFAVDRTGRRGRRRRRRPLAPAGAQRLALAAIRSRPQARRRPAPGPGACARGSSRRRRARCAVVVSVSVTPAGGRCPQRLVDVARGRGSGRARGRRRGGRSGSCRTARCRSRAAAGRSGPIEHLLAAVGRLDVGEPVAEHRRAAQLRARLAAQHRAHAGGEVDGLDPAVDRRTRAGCPPSDGPADGAGHDLAAASRRRVSGAA